MIKDLYSTNMSSQAKNIQLRFEKIRRKHGKISKIVSVFMCLSLIMIISFATHVIAGIGGLESTDTQKISFMSNGKQIDFENKPFVENGTVYLPLRELFESLGIMDNENSYINWDNGKIKLCIAETILLPDYENGGESERLFISNYGFEIGIPQIVLNPEGTLPDDKAHLSIRHISKYAPVLKDGVTFIPYEFVNLMLNRTDQLGKKYNIICIVGEDNPNVFLTPHILWPTESEKVTNKFGNRTHPITNEIKEHNGIDIVADEGSNVISVISGIVEDAGYDSEKGNFVVITGENNISVLYAHLKSINVNKGDLVNRKDVVGQVGSTGMSTGPHLHYEIKINGRYCDPMLFY